MPKSFIEIVKCNCEQSLSLEKELFEQKMINKELNAGIDCDLEYERLSDGMYVMYKVGFAKYQAKMKQATRAIQRAALVEARLDALIKKIGDKNEYKNN